VAEFSIWPDEGSPFPLTADADSPVSLGTRFDVLEPVDLVALRFWRGAASIGGPVHAAVFEVTGPGTGEQIMLPVAFELSGTGWHRAELPAPVPLAPGSFKVVAHFPAGFTAVGGYWATGAGVGGIVSGPLSAPDASVEGGQGTFAYGSALTYPTGFFNGGGYPVDVVLSDGDEEPNPDPSNWRVQVRPRRPRFGSQIHPGRYDLRQRNPRWASAGRD